MKSIAIITFQNANNYGALLQAYALQETVKRIGYNVSICDYHCPYLDNRMYIASNRNPKYIIKNGVKRILRLNRNESGFDRFRKKKLNLTVKYTSRDIREITNEFDTFIVGSDQVWNPHMTNFDDVYFLSFAKDKNRVSYAASLGVAELNDNILKEISKLLEGFKSISVRENSGVDMLTKMGVKNVVRTIDPVFLLSKQDWNEQTEYFDGLPEEYVFVYALGDVDILVSKAKQNWPEYPIVCLSKVLPKRESVIVIHSVECMQFLGLICHARAVITNSFHGTCFSIIFEKDYKYVLHKDVDQDRSTRLYELAKLLHVEAHDSEIGANVNNSNVDNSVKSLIILNNEIEQSMTFLKNALV